MSNQKRSGKNSRGGASNAHTRSKNTGNYRKGGGHKPDQVKVRTQFDLLKPLHSALETSDLTATQRFILMALHFWMDGEGKCYPSYSKIAKRASLHRSTVVRNMHDIVKKGWLTYDKGDSATARPNTYYLNLDKLSLDDNKADKNVPIVNLKDLVTFADAQAAVEVDGSLFTFTPTPDELQGYTVEYSCNSSVFYFRTQEEIDLLKRFSKDESAYLAMMRALFVQGERKRRKFTPSN